MDHPVSHVHIIASRPNTHLNFTTSLLTAVRTAAQRAAELEDTLKQFLFVIPRARAPAPTAWCSHPDQSLVLESARQAQRAQQAWFRGSARLRTAIVRRQLFFPDRRLLQFDCGKLQVSPAPIAFPCVQVCRNAASLLSSWQTGQSV